jgi:acetyl-CoA acyltransferase
MPNAVITHFRRSPFQFATKGAFARTRPDDLAAQVVAKLVADSGIAPEDIEDLILGCTFPEGEQGLNLGRLLSFMTHLPLSVAGTTINRFCGSSMTSIHMAVGAIAAGAGDVFICAGVESMTRVPIPGFNPSPNPALYKEFPQAYISMGETSRSNTRLAAPGRTNSPSCPSSGPARRPRPANSTPRSCPSRPRMARSRPTEPSAPRPASKVWPA